MFRTFPVNPLVASTDAPPIPEAQGWRALYDGRHGPLIDLSQAVPGHAPPAEFLARLAEVAADGASARYGPILGDMVLREAFAAETQALYAGDIGAENIAITAGCNLAFVVAMMLVARAGDNVILPGPWYFNHRMTLDMLGIGTKALPTSAKHGFIPDPAEAASLIDAGTRAIILVSPNNPTGAIYPLDVIAGFAELASRRGLALVLDETYRDFLSPEQSPPHALLANPEWGNTLISLYSFSKAYAIPGHRLGAMIAAPAIISEIAKLLDCLQICPARPAQAATAWAIEGVRHWRHKQAAELSARAAACRQAFAGAPGWSLHSVGAYFAYAAHPFAGVPAREAARRLAVEAGILGLPGSYFGEGQETHLRLAFANVGVDTLAAIPQRLAEMRRLAADAPGTTRKA